MWVSKLELKNYKNLNIGCNLTQGLNVVNAPNGSGKTNLIEALHYFTSGSSFRGIDDDYILPFNQDALYSSASIVVHSGDAAESLKLVWTNSKKAYWFNDLKTNRSRFNSYLKSMVHAPSTIDIMVSSAKLRRDFLDGLLLQLRPKYFRPLFSSYKRVLFQKAKLLNMGSGYNNYVGKQARGLELEEQLSYWNEKIVLIGSEIASERYQLLKTILPIMSDLARSVYSLSDYEPEFEIQSKYFPESRRLVDISTNQLTQLISAEFLEKLKHSGHKELLAGRVLYGPHLDDILFSLAGKSVRYGSSRGQQRLYSLILNLAAVSLLESEHEDKFVLLLDDIFSELDREHRMKTFETILAMTMGKHPNQVILALPDIADIPIPSGTNNISLKQRSFRPGCLN